MTIVDPDVTTTLAELILTVSGEPLTPSRPPPLSCRATPAMKGDELDPSP